MARRARLEFAGAVYHVLDRGDRREAIFGDDRDREMFLATLGAACAQAGWRVHAYVLMGNHEHLLLETPQANLVKVCPGFNHLHRAIQPPAPVGGTPFPRESGKMHDLTRGQVVYLAAKWQVVIAGGADEKDAKGAKLTFDTQVRLR